MKFEAIQICNYKALRNVRIPLSDFVCLIGENNSGKSTLLRAVEHFYSGAAIPSTDFYDPGSDIRIEVQFSRIGESDLARLADEHRNRISEIIKEGTVNLVRVYSPDGKSRLYYRGPVPTDSRFSTKSIDSLVAGQRPGSAFVSRVLDVFPKLEGGIDSRTNQSQVRDAIEALIQSLPESKLALGDRELPSGFDRSVTPFLPEPILIPAVKDLGDDVKGRDNAAFGKTLRILLDDVEQELADAASLFRDLDRRLNPHILDDGTEDQSERISQLIQLERTMNGFVNETFGGVDVKIRIPPPQLRTIFQGATILANDGVEGGIDTKGDGLRRAVVFAILRTYVELMRQGSGHEEARVPSARYVLLFEEPELYLHPNAQLILFNALKQFSERHAVIMSTHSPLFLGPEAGETFVKLSRVAPAGSPKPYSEAYPVDLGDVGAKDQFQIICYENNNAAFFSRTVILVEGDSDLLVLPHIASVLNESWVASQRGACYAKVNGKSSIRRYRQFFKHFGVRVPIITDLDLLVHGFEQIEPDAGLQEARAQLLEKADALIPSDSGQDPPSLKTAGAMHGSSRVRVLCGSVVDAYKALESGDGSLEDAEQAFQEFYGYVRKDDRLEVLKESDDPDLKRLLRKLLAELRERDVFVLERGAIEAYYPADLNSGDKPSRAQEFCRRFTTRDSILGCCSELDGYGEEGCRKEFEIIFERIFRDTSL